MISLGYPHLDRLVARQLEAFPDHESFLERRFSPADSRHFAFAEDIAAKVMQIAGADLDLICRDYRWLSGLVLDEELHFRRTGRYRLSTFVEARTHVYSNAALMSRYMNGLLASQLWWQNHTSMLQFFRDEFIAKNPADFTHLEVGPGHGLFLYLAAASTGCGSAEGWDISDASLETTRRALDAMQLRKAVSLEKTDIFSPPKKTFTSIAFSEVLEHLERPQDALAILRGLLADGGRLFLNAPVNSPAPDHIYLFETPEHVLRMIDAAGFEVENSLFAPCTGTTLDRARRRKLTISVGAIVRKA